MWTQPIVKPQYDTDCFSLVPSLIRAAFHGDPFPLLDQANLRGPFQHVVSLFIDAFGWRFFTQYADAYPALRRFVEQGHIVRLTSQFPSTTAVHVTTMFTGQIVGQHGVYEWHYYEPSLDIIITPLLFTYAGTRERETLHALHPDLNVMFPSPAFLLSLKSSGIRTYVFMNKLFAHSTFSTYMMQGADVVPFSTLPQALTQLRLMLETIPGPVLFHLYYEAIDTIAHEHGPESPHVEGEIDTFLTVLERQFFAKLPPHLCDTLILLFADHGMMAVSPEETIYINTHPLYPQLDPLLRRNKRGEVLAPAGSPRDMFLYIEENALSEAQHILTRITNGRADVVLTQELIDQGFFGPGPLSQRFLERVGNLIVLPHPREAVWWYEKDRFEQKQRGHHGGLSPEEMNIPLLLWAT